MMLHFTSYGRWECAGNWHLTFSFRKVVMKAFGPLTVPCYNWNASPFLIFNFLDGTSL